jgi:HlyD family secretion protein
MNKYYYLLTAGLLIFASCSNKDNEPDAYGNFEVIETVISSESSGKIIKSFIEEGDEIKPGDTAFLIDNTSILLQKQTLLNQKNSVTSGFSTIIAQSDVLRKQKEVLDREKARIQRLLKDSAATQKQFDDVCGQADILVKQITQVEVQNQKLFNDLKVFDAQIKTIDDLLKKTIVINPLKGIVLVKYSENYELVMPGKPLYKIADLSEIILRAYISETQLQQIKIGQSVDVFIDQGGDKEKSFKGKIIWISTTPEFTPKTIQTKEERVNMVYALKIKVKNDGSIKPGMPGDVRF